MPQGAYLLDRPQRDHLDTDYSINESMGEDQLNSHASSCDTQKGHPENGYSYAGTLVRGGLGENHDDQDESERSEGSLVDFSEEWLAFHHLLLSHRDSDDVRASLVDIARDRFCTPGGVLVTFLDSSLEVSSYAVLRR